MFALGKYCTFFIKFTDANKPPFMGNCVLVEEDLMKFLTRCQAIGGPVTPTISECSQTDDLCQVSYNYYLVLSRFKILQ